MKRKLLASAIWGYLIFLMVSYLLVMYLVPKVLPHFLYAISEDAEYRAYLYRQAIAIQNVCYLLMSIVFLLSLVPIMIFHIKVYVPLNRISEAASHYMEGTPYPPAIYTKDDELGRINATLCYLANSADNSDNYQQKLIANVSHDFRSPLTSIKGYVQAILDGTVPPELQSRYLQIILDETERLTKLTSGILQLNTITDGGLYLDITVFDMNEVLLQAERFFEHACQIKHLKIQTSLPGHPMYVSADRLRIQQVLYNLIDNAIKFSPQNKEILLRVYRKNRSVFVSVKDFGIGISPENLPKIWTRFYKTDPSRGRDRKGTGLGLPIAKEIICAHNQNINVISTEGIGTEFIFTLAAAKPESEPSKG